MICIMKCCFTYFSKPLVAIVLISFISSFLSLNILAVNTCKAESSDCCCKKHSETFSLNLTKKCCCEIKVATERQDEFILYKTDTYNKLNSYSVKTTVETNINSYSLYSLSGKIISFHSPPREDICIFNSTFRI